MRHQSSIYPGVLIMITASLIAVQACDKNNLLGNNYALVEAEIAQASSQALHHFQACYTTGQEVNCDQYKEYKSILERLSSSNAQAANALLEMQQLESSMAVTSEMQGLIGEL